MAEFNDNQFFLYPPFKHPPMWSPDADHAIPVVSPVGMGPKGDKGDPAYFDDLTDQQLSKIYQEASFVGNKSEDAIVTTAGSATTTIAIPFDDYNQFDMLFIDVNGLDLAENEDYTIVNGNVVLTAALPAGQDVHFRLLRYTLVDGSKTIMNTMGRKDYNTVAEMKADGNLKSGDICHTLGYSTPGDGKGGWYKIESHGVANDNTVIAVGQNLFAVLSFIDDNPKEDAYPFSIEYAQAGIIPIANESYTQGATTDGTYIYVFSAPISGSGTVPYISKYTTSFELISRFYFTDYPSIGHGNSIAYDAINDVIVIYSSNRYITIMSKGLEVLSHTNTGTGTQVYAVSQVGISDSYMILNLTSSNTFYFYYRFASKLFALYGFATFPLARGKYNLLQDCFIHNNYFYSMTSSIGGNTYFDVFSVHGAYVCRFVLRKLYKEIEGCFVLGDKVYMIASDGYVYTAQLSSFAISDITPDNTIASNLVPVILRCQQPGNWVNLSGYLGSLHGTVNTGSSVPRRIFDNPMNTYHNKYFSADERYTCQGRNGWGVSRTTGDNLRCCVFAHTLGVHLVFYYTKSSGYQYLSSIECIKNDGTLIRQNFNDTDDDATAGGKLDTFITNCGFTTDLTMEFLGNDPTARTDDRALQGFVEIITE